jgi:hypothetical protein
VRCEKKEVLQNLLFGDGKLVMGADIGHILKKNGYTYNGKITEILLEMKVIAYLNPSDEGTKGNHCYRRCP